VAGGTLGHLEEGGIMRTRKEDSVELWSQLSVLVAEVGTALDRRLSEDFDLGLTDFLALRALCNGDPVGIRMNELAQLLGLNQSSATRAVQRLESRELVERAAHATDRRGVVVRVTDAGRTLVADIGGLFRREVGMALEVASMDSRTSSVVARLRYAPNGDH
jgi:DNA-binding MarR family transcriptional regulator